VRCPKEIEDQEHEQVLTRRAARDRLRTRIAGNTSGWTWQRIRTEASRLHAPSRSPARPPIDRPNAFRN
jgi:hypothetical protein